MINTERALIWNSLCNMGQTMKLKWKINEHEVLEQLEQFKDNWCPYNVKKDTHNNRLSLIHI